MAKARKTWKLVLTSIILSIIILAAFTAVFISLIVPSYDITQEQIYSVLTKALPILIGLVFLEIALISSRRGDDDFRDNIDKLSPNSYDSPLYTPPIDDPDTASSVNAASFDRRGQYSQIREIIKEVPVEVVKEVVKEVPREIIREVPVPVEKIVEKPVEVVKEVLKEIPIEVVKEVQVPVIKEIPVEKIIEKPVEIIKEVPVEKIVEVEKPVEVVKEAPVDADIIIRHNYKPVEIKVPVDRIVEKEVPVDVIKETVIEKGVPVEGAEIKEVEVEKIIERVVEVPVETIVEKPVEVIKEVPVEKIVERIVEVPIEKIVEKPIEVIKEVPVDRIIEKVVEVPVEKIVEKPVEVVKEVPVEVEKVVEVPVERIVEKTVEVAGGEVEEATLSVLEAIEEEIDSSRASGYSLVIASFPSDSEAEVEKNFGVPALLYGEKVFAILPYTRAKDTATKVKALGGRQIVVTARYNASSVVAELSK